MSANGLCAAGLQALADTPCLPQLRSLNLRCASRPRHSPCHASLCGARSAPRVCGVRQQARRSGRPGVADAAGQAAAARTAQPRRSAPRRGPTRPRRSKSRACYVDSPPHKFHICVCITLYVYISVYINASVQSHCMRPCVCHAHLIMLCIHVCASCMYVYIYMHRHIRARTKHIPAHTACVDTYTCLLAPFGMQYSRVYFARKHVTQCRRHSVGVCPRFRVCVYVCMCVCMYICISMYVCMCFCMHVSMYVCVYYVCMSRMIAYGVHVCITCVRIMCVRLHSYVCMYVCLFDCICVCVIVWKSSSSSIPVHIGSARVHTCVQ